MEVRPAAALVAHQSLIWFVRTSCGVHLKIGRPKVHSVIKAWHLTGSNGSERPAATVL